MCAPAHVGGLGKCSSARFGIAGVRHSELWLGALWELAPLRAAVISPPLRAAVISSP
jgi:hypothetical protein